MLDSLKTSLISLQQVGGRIILNYFRCLVQVLLIKVHALCNVSPLVLEIIPVPTTLHQNQVLLVTFKVLI